MAEFVNDYGLFLAKTLTLVLALLFIVASLMSLTMRGRKEMEKGNLQVQHLNKDIERLRQAVKKAVFDKAAWKLETRAEKRRKKAEAKANKARKGQPGADERSRLYVLDFEGDIKAAEVVNLRQAITAVLQVARPEQDEVMLRLESPGGVVHGYGLAASQLKRIRDRNIKLTICVDKVAASGGYMMACLGDRVLAAPFAYIGSVGVVLQMPNFHRWMDEHKIDYEMVTAGQYKRTLTVFGENSDEDRAKVREELQDAHELFKDFIRQHRPTLDVDSIATGEVWFGTRALEKGLVDEIKTSDEVLVEACAERDVYHVVYQQKKAGRRFGRMLERAMDSALRTVLLKTSREKFYS